MDRSRHEEENSAGIFVNKREGDENMSYKTIYEETWETKGEKGSTRLQAIFNTEVRRDGDIALRTTITEENRKYGATKIFPSYKLIREIILALVNQNGKAEVEKELGVKIK